MIHVADVAEPLSWAISRDNRHLGDRDDRALGAREGEGEREGIVVDELRVQGWLC